MKRKILYSFVAMIALVYVLLKIGVVYVEISPYAHYKLNENEAGLINVAIAKLRERVENEKFDEIEDDLADGRTSKSEIVEEIKKARRKFGKPVGMEFFRAMPPKPVSKYYDNLAGTFYDVKYFTNTDDGDFFSEGFYWIVKENNEVQLLNYSAGHIRDWELREREVDRTKAGFSNEVRILFGERFIEIRY